VARRETKEAREMKKYWLRGMLLGVSTALLIPLITSAGGLVSISGDVV
jgi:hypothetical protein